MMSGMGAAAASDLQEVAVLDGGPMDGRQGAVDSDTDQLRVVMDDGQLHRYARTDKFQALEDGQLALVFRWTGRYFGLE